ncbi:MAG: cytochrome c biogenesis CcdA family protein [Mycobacteriaceae bacterium]|nr:cytochrome c biogenesis CcdA family protein [Mycobacteriaceae bacterium]
MNHTLIGLAFAAGLVAALNPCGFAMLPAYLLLVVRERQAVSPIAAVGRALAATLGMALGFMTVFGLFGALTISAASTVQRYLPYVTVVIGVVLLVLGAWLLSGRELTVSAPIGPRWAPSARLGSFYGYGVSYAIASLSCTVGPFLAVTGAGLRGGSALDGVAVYGSYIAGLTLVVAALAVAAATARSTLVSKMRAVLPFVNRLSGVLLVLVGAYVGYYGVYEVRLFGANGNPEDAVIAAAGRLQGTLAAWVHEHGGWPWAVVLALALGVTWGLRRRARHHDRLNMTP